MKMYTVLKRTTYIKVWKNERGNAREKMLEKFYACARVFVRVKFFNRGEKKKKRKEKKNAGKINEEFLARKN